MPGVTDTHAHTDTHPGAVAGPTDPGGTMTIKGVDAAGRLSGAAVRAGGFAFAARYLDTGGTSAVKTWLSPAEVADHRAHDVALLGVHEIGANDVLAGRMVARERARRVLDDLAALGMPDAVGWWTADRDIVATNLPAAVDYARGWSDVLGRGRRGCYGDRDLLDALFAAGLIDYGWQAGASAWSHRTVSPHAHIIQNAATVSVGGIQCDLNEVAAGITDYGQWPRPNEGDDMTPDQAQMLKNLHDELIPAGRARGQVSVGSTIAATLGTVQHLVNVEAAQPGTIAAMVGTAVTDAVAKLEVTGVDTKALAAAIVAELGARLGGGQ